METLDDSLRSSEDENAPLIPHPDSLRVSDQQARRLREILNASGDRQYTKLEAKYRGEELLRLTVMLLDPERYKHNLEHPLLPPGFPMSPLPPDTPPVPRAFPIKLDADHPREIERSLKMLTDELRFVKRRPTHWRWALVALYEALGHTLAAHRPATFLPYTGLDQVTRLFDAVVGENPELPQVRESVGMIDRLRTTYITWGITRWPVGLNNLPGIFIDCIQVMRRHDATAETSLGGIERCLLGSAPRTLPRRSAPGHNAGDDNRNS
ncbi:MAG: hypothetical protein HOP12_09740 [Candidatus Eisenbacteria bacterium]|uniref:Uncharacterized protein n=1 Tax=Eiseniibacteriota bacterium TaxID=2212470 RepID=A0A849SFB3_UNCEI|nr:hypothetical protein [Candidatus Eisenbacteria bacterium]